MKKHYIKYITALLLFGSNGIVASHIALNSYEIVCLRTFIGSVLLVSIFLLTGNRFTFYKSVKSFIFLAISGIAMGLSWMFLYEAYHRTGVSIPWVLFLGIANTGIGCLLYFLSIGNLPVQTVAVTGYLEPLSAVIFSVLFLHEYMGIIQIAGMICIIGGAVWSEGIVNRT